MSRWKRFAAWLKRRGATQAIEFHPPSTRFFGPGIGSNQPAHEDLLRENLGPAASATQALADRISTLNPVVVTSRLASDGTEIDEILDDHILKKLLDRPHPDYSRATLLALTAQYIVTVGEAYWLKVGNGLRRPARLQPISPNQVEPILEGGITTGYSIQAGDGSRFILPADVIIRFFKPDPEAPWRSEGYLGPTGTIVDSFKFATQHLRAHYQNDATPKVALEALENATPFTPETKAAFRDLWRQMYHSRSGDEIGTPAITPTGYKLVQLALQSGADITPLLEFWRDEVLMAFRTPRSILGQVVSGDRSSAEATAWIYDMHAIQPLANLIADTLTLKLAPDFDPSLSIRFEPFVSEDKAHILAQEQHDIEHGVRTINRVLQDRADEPVAWGEKPLTLAKLKVFDPDRQSPQASPPPPTDDGNDTPADDPDPDRSVAPAARRRRARSHRARRSKAA